MNDDRDIVQQRKRRKKMPVTDMVIGATGVALAAFATFFPWYAFFNQDKFSIPTLWRGDTRDLSTKIGSPSVNVSPQAMTNSSGKPTPVLPDTLTTATVPTLEGGPPPVGAQADAEQPFPVPTGFKLMHVANGRALIEDGNGMYIVRVGSVLPDNSRLARFEEREGAWVMVTSKGDVFAAN
ncbi:flagellar protein [Ensifer soli]|uniref:flagellar protein n=1 Tax=Ciceribacter sp. sgz301302 TaxID=3342379 RepID=UPI0035B75C73